MSALRPTPTRLRLLRDVRAGLIRRAADGHDYHHVTGRRVDAQIQAAKDAGWVELGPRAQGTAAIGQWRLTPEGEAVGGGHVH